MLRPLSTFTAAAAMVLLAACTQAPPPAPDTREADAKAIRDVEAQSLAAFKNKEIEKGAAMQWADDATLAIANMPLLNGHAAILAWAKDTAADPNFSIDYAPTTVEVSKSSDYGYTRGTYTFGMSDPKTKKPMMEKGKYVTVYKKQADGAWKAVADMLNADAPAMAMPAAAKK
jgi:ketosteroid isomerase-like protein